MGGGYCCRLHWSYSLPAVQLVCTSMCADCDWPTPAGMNTMVCMCVCVCPRIQICVCMCVVLYFHVCL